MSQSQQCLSCYMIQERYSRNADFISIAAKGGYPQPSGHRPVKPKNPPAEGRSNFRTFFRPSEPSEPFESSEPSRPKGVSVGDTTTLGPKGRCPLKHNPPPLGGHNLRGRRPRKPSPLNLLNLLNPLNPLNPATQWLHGRFLSISNPMFHCTYRTVIL